MRILRLLRRVTLWLVALIVALPLILLSAGFGVMRITLPAGDATARIPGLSAPVEVTLDRHGVPYVKAATEHDAWAAMGWLHARDRLFQMELMRRGAAGRLAEIVGAQGLFLDRYVRTLGLWQAAESDYAALPPETREALSAYARGVNAWISEKGRWAAPEFVLLGITPEPWRELDSLLWGKGMALFLSGNARTELARLRLSTTLARARIDELWPKDESEGNPVAAGPLPAGLAPREVVAPLLPHLDRLLAAIPTFGPELGRDAPIPPTASNIWAVTGSRSVTGLPIIANDPHLAFSKPIQWYLARVETPEMTLVGAFAPGVPFLVLGRNAHIAWGMTTTHSDTQDVFIERLVGDDRYLTPEGPRSFAVREETIRVRFGEPVTLRVRQTRNGPVLSDIDPTPGTPDGHVLSASMTAIWPGDQAAAGLHRLNRARSFEEADRATSVIGAPQQNIVIADRAGRMGMVMPARVPLRRAGDGAFPAPAHDGSHGWMGFAPVEALPRFIDPPAERVANANNRVAPDDFPVFLTRNWWGDFRYRRILERLDVEPVQTVESMAAIQMDLHSIAARELLPLMTAIPDPPGGREAQALALLRGWDAVVAKDRPEPLLFHAWLKHLGRRIAAETIGPEADTFREHSAEFLLFVLSRGQHWCGTGGCAPLLGRALADAVAELTALLGPDMPRWSWGEQHVVRLQHPLMRFVPVIGDWFATILPTPGDGHTIMRAGMRLSGRTPFENVHGGGYRGVYDLADLENSRFIIATGQSGHPLSAHYRDLALTWATGGHVTIPAAPDGRSGRISLTP